MSLFYDLQYLVGAGESSMSNKKYNLFFSFHLLLLLVLILRLMIFINFSRYGAWYQ